MLDDAVAGNQDEGGGEVAENVMKSSLITLLRTKFEETGPVLAADNQDGANGLGPSSSSPSSNVAASSTVEAIDVDAPSPPADILMGEASPLSKVPGSPPIVIT